MSCSLAFKNWSRALSFDRIHCLSTHLGPASCYSQYSATSIRLFCPENTHNVFHMGFSVCTVALNIAAENVFAVVPKPNLNPDEYSQPQSASCSR
jgi:hypothetical protein